MFKSLIKIEINDRPTIEVLLTNEYFDEVREQKTFPKDLTSDQSKLIEIKKDVIQRENVHKLLPRDEFLDMFRKQIDDEVGPDY